MAQNRAARRGGVHQLRRRRQEQDRVVTRTTEHPQDASSAAGLNDGERRDTEISPEADYSLELDDSSSQNYLMILMGVP
ncbi:hypothetical protein GX50_05306 [[Emmonsia] crescens]|uniref:Uncharacterized protein n=1 Tax=[Emmonsia] crescens TaxID=73230 RepID=A0A2B7ZFG4_9EURO|nr:hypothetical protein GX50_05306 [Emmonsia crescens]